MELSEFLLARIAEDESSLSTARRMGVPVIPTGSRITSGIGNHPTMSETRMAAECEAKRLLIAIDSRQAKDKGILAALALPYADHPDYREEWKP